MPDEHMGGLPLEFQSDLAIWSLVTSLVFLIPVVIVAVNWYRNKPIVPAVILTASILLGLLNWPVLAIVSAVLLVGLVISSVLRRPVLSRGDELSGNIEAGTDI